MFAASLRPSSLLLLLLLNSRLSKSCEGYHVSLFQPKSRKGEGRPQTQRGRLKSFAADAFQSYTCSELKDCLAQQGLAHTGIKAALMQRLVNSIGAELSLSLSLSIYMYILCMCVHSQWIFPNITLCDIFSFSVQVRMCTQCDEYLHTNSAGILDVRKQVLSYLQPTIQRRLDGNTVVMILMDIRRHHDTGEPSEFS